MMSSLVYSFPQHLQRPAFSGQDTLSPSGLFYHILSSAEQALALTLSLQGPVPCGESLLSLSEASVRNPSPTDIKMMARAYSR